MLNIKNICVITGLGYVFIPHGLKKKILKSFVCLLYKIALRKTHEVWLLNQDDLQAFLRNHLVSKDRVKLLDSEGVDTEHFAPIKEIKEGMNAKLNEESSFVLIARMLYDKGVLDLIKAIRILKETSNTTA